MTNREPVRAGSFAEIFEAEMADDDFDAVACAEALSHLLGEIDGAVLATGAAESDQQMLEAALLIAGDASVDQLRGAGKKLVHAFLLLEVVDDRSVLASESFEAVLAAGIGEAAAIEDEAAAVAGIVLRQALMKRETEDADDEMVGFGGDALQFLGSEHGLECAEECGKRDGKLDVVEEPTEILEGVRNGLQKMSFAFVEAAEAVSTKRLHDAHVDVGIVVAKEAFAVDRNAGFESTKVVV